MYKMFSYIRRTSINSRMVFSGVVAGAITIPIIYKFYILPEIKRDKEAEISKHKSILVHDLLIETGIALDKHESLDINTQIEKIRNKIELSKVTNKQDNSVLSSKNIPKTINQSNIEKNLSQTVLKENRQKIYHQEYLNLLSMTSDPVIFSAVLEIYDKISAKDSNDKIIDDWVVALKIFNYLKDHPNEKLATTEDCKLLESLRLNCVRMYNLHIDNPGSIYYESMISKLEAKIRKLTNELIFIQCMPSNFTYCYDNNSCITFNKGINDFTNVFYNNSAMGLWVYLSPIDNKNHRRLLSDGSFLLVKLSVDKPGTTGRWLYGDGTDKGSNDYLFRTRIIDVVFRSVSFRNLEQDK